MKKISYRAMLLLFTTFFLVISNGCKDCPSGVDEIEEGDHQEQEEVFDEYYVRYNLVGRVTVGQTPAGEVDIRIEDNSTATFGLTSLSRWEVIIGPVQKGFYADLNAKATQETFNRLFLTAEIHVSKNNGPFALKVFDSSDSPRDRVSISYTIE